MNYTEKYHLPQWVETDRVMMRDFNQMCRDIDAGLDRNAQAAAAAAGAAADAASTAGAAVTPSALNSALFRAAYNHYHLVDRMEPIPRQSGVLRLPFVEGAKTTVTGFLQEKDLLWAANGTKLLTVSDLRSSFSSLQALSPTQRLMAATFTAPHPGLVTELHPFGRVTNSAAGDPGDCTVRLINQTNAKQPVLEHEERASFGFSKGNTGDGEFTLPVHFLLRTGQRYRLEVEMDNLNSRPELKLRQSDAFFKVTGYQTASASVSCGYQTEETGRGGLALVQYSYTGKAPTLKLTWEDSQLSPNRTRTFTDEQGRTMREAEFRRTAAVPLNSTLKITCTCPAGADVSVYQLGAVLI